METQTRFTSTQIEAAKKNAELHGLRSKQKVTDAQAIEWLLWYHSHNTEYASVKEAAIAGLCGLVTNGIAQQMKEWNRIFAQPLTG